MGFNVKIDESITLDGAKFENSVTYFSNLASHYEKKVIPVTTVDGGQTLYTCSSDGSGGLGDYDYDNVKYARISNLHYSYTLFLEVISGGQYFYFSVGSGGSFIINNHKSFLDGGSNPFANGFVTSVKGEASGSGVNVELFIAYDG
tara:strand:+ start:3222 stop:3659 length:438 start_codon:yes stop_codon:yes gene_type:complete